MSEGDDFSRLDDPAFLAERRRVREALERVSEGGAAAELSARCQLLDDEFVRRVTAAWARAGQGAGE